MSLLKLTNLCCSLAMEGENYFVVAPPTPKPAQPPRFRDQEHPLLTSTLSARLFMTWIEPPIHSAASERSRWKMCGADARRTHVRCCRSACLLCTAPRGLMSGKSWFADHFGCVRQDLPLRDPHRVIRQAVGMFPAAIAALSQVLVVGRSMDKFLGAEEFVTSAYLQ